jgi:hypothetical protein
MDSEIPGCLKCFSWFEAEETYFLPSFVPVFDKENGYNFIGNSLLKFMRLKELGFTSVPYARLFGEETNEVHRAVKWFLERHKQILSGGESQRPILRDFYEDCAVIFNACSILHWPSKTTHQCSADNTSWKWG